MKTTLQAYVWDLYKKHKEHKLVGIYGFYNPILIVTDPNIIKQIIVKDFNSFSGSAVDVDMKLDPVFAINPFSISDMETWKEMRGLHVSLLSPSKLKSMPDLMMKIGPKMINFIKKSENGTVKVKDVSELLAIDTVTIFSYGLEPTAFTDPENCFVKHARDFFTKESSFAMNGYVLFPRLVRLLSYRSITKEGEEFFISFCKKMVDYRKKNPSNRLDFFEHMAKVNKKRQEEGKKIISVTEIGLHCMTAYLDSFFTTASTFGYFLMEISKNPEVQDRLRDEIFAVGKKIEDFDYDKVNSLTFMQMALTESLRMHPPVTLASRACSKSCEVAGKKIQAGTRILLPYVGLQMDPDYYPEPQKYMPERYLCEDSLVKGTLLPFGDGPRMCLGFRYAQILIKVGIIYLLLNFRIFLEKKVGGKNEKKEFFVLDTPSENLNVTFEPLEK